MSDILRGEGSEPMVTQISMAGEMKSGKKLIVV